MNLYSFANAADLRIASGRKFLARFREAADTFANEVKGCIDPALISALSEVQTFAADTPATRAWTNTCTQLMHEADSRDYVPSSLLISHLKLDSASVERIYELLAWEGLGAACSTSSLMNAYFDSPPPAVLSMGTDGSFDIGEVQQDARWHLECGSVISFSSSDGFRAHSKANRTRYWRPNPTITSSNISAKFPIYTPALTISHFQEFPIITSPLFVSGWQRSLIAASDILASYSGGASNSVSELVTCVLPLVCGHSAVGSGSREELLGQVYLPATDALGVLTECLLHEVMHQYLFRLEECRSIFGPETQEDARFYSPWRADPRPLRMVFHGALVFACVADLYLWDGAAKAFGQAAGDCVRRSYHCARQARIALDIVSRNASMTEIGALLFADVEKDIGRVLESASPTRDDQAAVEEQLSNHEKLYAAYAR